MESQDNMFETGVLEGNYMLKDEFGSPVAPEYFITIFKNTPFYEDVRKFARRVDNDTGIPFLTKKEYNASKKIFPKEMIEYVENTVFSQKNEIIYLRNKSYYLNLNEETSDNLSKAEFACDLLQDSLSLDLSFCPLIDESADKATSLEERMLVGSLLDLYKNHLLIVFTGLYESMKLDEQISVDCYNSVREEIEANINNYYTYIITGKKQTSRMNQEKILPAFESIKNVVKKTQKIYDGKRYLAREFDHPGRMVLYAGHLLSQIKNKGKKYDLLVNLLNGSAEIGLAVKTIDAILNTNRIADIAIFEVDFARYSMKDREDQEVSNYSEFEKVAIPSQLRQMFRERLENKNTLLVDDNINTGKSLYYVLNALTDVTACVDISVVEVTPITRARELIEEDLRRKGKTEIDPDVEIKLNEKDLTYTPIGWWRDQPAIKKDRIIENIIGLE